jgi:hypothetical protein
LVQHPDLPAAVETVEMREVVTVTGLCDGFFLLLDVLFVIHVVVMVVVVLEHNER